MTLIKRRVYTVLFFGCAVAVLSFLFMASTNGARAAHQDILNRLGRTRALDSNFRLEAYRVRTFLSPNYDALVASSDALSRQCDALTVGEEAITGSYGDSFDTLLVNYCRRVSDRIDMSHELTSAVSILRNTARYLPSLELKGNRGKSRSEDLLGRTLLTSALAYLADSNEDIASTLNDSIQKIERRKTSSDSTDPVFAELLNHSKRIAKLVPEVDKLLRNLSDDESREAMLAVQPAYLKVYSTIDKRATNHQAFLLVASILILISAGVLLVKLRRSTEALAESNRTLEKRVEERTDALNATLLVVREQQASLIQSSKLSALGEMAGGIAHEINTPLATISLCVQNLKMLANEPLNNSDFIQELHETLERTVERIVKIISGLRKVSRDETLEAPTAVRISEVISDTVDLCKERFSAHGTKLIIVPFEEETRILCRSTEITQVLLNLMNNSFDAVQNLDVKWIKVDVQVGAGRAEMTITDSGPGIPVEIRQKIMQPFFTTKPVGKGTGLGLSLSASIMRAHGGELRLDENSANTKFILSIPLESLISDAA